MQTRKGAIKSIAEYVVISYSVITQYQMVQSRPLNDDKTYDCDMLQIGTGLGLDDILSESINFEVGGGVSRQIAPQHVYLQSMSHFFYIKGGHSLLTDIPKVHSIETNTEGVDNYIELQATSKEVESGDEDSVKI